VSTPAAPQRRTSRFHDRAVRRQLLRFVAVGVLNTVLSLAVYRLLLAVGAWYVLAAPIAYVASLLNGYLLNRNWTFGSRDSTRARVLYVAVQASGAVALSLLVVLLAGVGGLGKVTAFLVAAVPVTLCTFSANRIWTFADRRN
jgi:putative flippase GtrA